MKPERLGRMMSADNYELIVKCADGKFRGYMGFASDESTTDSLMKGRADFEVDTLEAAIEECQTMSMLEYGYRFVDLSAICGKAEASQPAAKCARTACKATRNIIFRHTQTDRMYCPACAKAINKYNPGLVVRQQPAVMGEGEIDAAEKRIGYFVSSRTDAALLARAARESTALRATVAALQAELERMRTALDRIKSMAERANVVYDQNYRCYGLGVDRDEIASIVAAALAASTQAVTELEHNGIEEEEK